MTNVSFTPDSHLVHAVVASPNHNERAGAGVADMVVLHYTGMRRDAGVPIELRRHDAILGWPAARRHGHRGD